MSWPVKVDVLEAQHIKKGSIGSGEQYCFLGWLDCWFKCGSPEYEIVKNIARRFTGAWLISIWNDRPHRSKAAIAKMINKVTAEVGYTEGNPEA